MTTYSNILIKSNKELNLFKESVNNTSLIAIDTEFTRKITYFAKLSLLQISTKPNVAFMLDYLETPELANEVLDIIYDSNAVKVFHAAKNDLEIFYNLKEELPTNIFDTQIAFMAISPLNNISYAALIKTILNQQLNKNETLSDWNQRPLTSSQIEYAALDVIMLYKAYFPLYAELKKQNRLEFITEKLNTLTDYSNYSFNLEKALERYLVNYNITGSYALLAAILDWREEAAKNHNIPRQHLLSDSNIKDVVNNPKSINKLLHKNKFLTLEAWQHLLDLAKNKFTYLNELFAQKSTLVKHTLLDISYYLLEFISNTFSINKDLICTKAEINQFLHYNSSLDTKNKIPKTFLVPWRYDIFTKKLQLLLDGKTCLVINNGKIEFK